MPRIPQVVSDVSPRTAPLSLGVAEQPGDAAARLGRDVAQVGSEIFNQQQQLWQARQAMDKTAQAGIESEKLYNQITTDPTIPDQDLVSSVTNGLKTLHDNIGKDIKDPTVKLIYDKNFTSLTVSRTVDAMALQRSRTIDNGRSSLETSLDTLGRLVPDATGQRLDAIMAQAEGNLSFAATSGLLSHDDATKRMIQFRDDAYTAKYIQQIRENAPQALSDLQEDTHLQPIKKEQLINSAQDHIVAQANQYIADRQKADEEATKQRKAHMDADVTGATAAALDGTYTHGELADLQAKYASGGEPLPAEKYEHLFDLINKPPMQPPSDPQTKAKMDILVHSMSPPALSTLHTAYSNGLLNLNDYTALSVDLEKNQKSLYDEGRTQNEKVINDEYSGDKEIHAAALKDLLSGASLQQVEQKYAAAYKTSSDFKHAQTSYESTLQQQQNWKTTHYVRSFASNKSNPYNDGVIRKTEELIKAAKTAHKLVGDADVGDQEGRIYTDANGTNVMAVGGKYIAQ